MIYIHSEHVKHLNVIWTYGDDFMVHTITFVDESELPINREIVRPKGLRYPISSDPIDFAISLYKSYYLQKSIAL